MSIDNIKCNIGEINQSHVLPELIDSINNNNLAHYYPQSADSSFKQSIDDLNLLFFYETEKILSRQSSNVDLLESKDKLFIILFKQISLYIKEIERLNQAKLNHFKANPRSYTKMMTTSINQGKQGINNGELINNNNNFNLSNNSIQQTQRPLTVINGNSIDSKTNSCKYKMNDRHTSNKSEVNETTFTSFSSNDNSSNNAYNSNNANKKTIIESKGNENKDKVAPLIAQPKKKRTLSDNNPYPAYPKNIAACATLQILNTNESHKSPFINRANNKLTNFKIIQKVKQKQKAEEENTKTHSPLRLNANDNMLNCNGKNQLPLSNNHNKQTLLNEMIIYETQINDMTQIEEMLIDLKRSISINKHIVLPKLTSISLDSWKSNSNHDNKHDGIDTPHFEMIPSFISVDLLIEGKNGQ